MTESETVNLKEQETPIVKKPSLNLMSPEGLDFLRDFVTIARGGDPRTRQTLNDFVDLKSKVQKTNLPTKKDVQRVAYFLYVGKSLFPYIDDDPFTLAADCIAEASMARGGEKSKQVVDLFKRTPSMVDLKDVQEAEKQGFFQNLIGGES